MRPITRYCHPIFLILFCFTSTYAGINDPINGSLTMRLNESRIKAKSIRLQTSGDYKRLRNGTKVFGAEVVKDECGTIKIIAAKGKDLYIKGTVYNRARCRRKLK